jgi:hypothetical protein
MGNASVNGLYGHDHASPAIRIIVYAFLSVGRIITQVMKMNLHQSFVDSIFIIEASRGFTIILGER